MKYWISKKGNDKLIVIDNEVIYSYNPSKSKISYYEDELRKGKIPKELTGTSISYIKKIITSDSSNIIKLYYGEDNETEIEAREHKLEIINYLNENDSRKPKYLEYPEKWYLAIKRPVIALIIILGLTYYLYDIAYFIELGYEYEVQASRGRGIAIGGLLLAAAEILGTLGIIVLGSILASITLWIAWKNYNLKRIIYELNFNK